jgi:hypothetical protein
LRLVVSLSHIALSGERSQSGRGESLRILGLGSSHRLLGDGAPPPAGRECSLRSRENPSDFRARIVAPPVRRRRDDARRSKQILPTVGFVKKGKTHPSYPSYLNSPPSASSPIPSSSSHCVQCAPDPSIRTHRGRCCGRRGRRGGGRNRVG